MAGLDSRPMSSLGRTRLEERHAVGLEAEANVRQSLAPDQGRPAVGFGSSPRHETPWLVSSQPWSRGESQLEAEVVALRGSDRSRRHRVAGLVTRPER
jgi:hypothetical protein